MPTIASQSGRADSTPRKKAGRPRGPSSTVTISTNTIIAALRRGWSVKMVSRAAGVSHQAVQQRLSRYAPEYKLLKRDPRHLRRVSLLDRLKKCVICETTFEPTDSEQLFCSKKCHGISQREISEAAVQTAISMRKNGHTWKHVAQVVGAKYYQTLQFRIWEYLRTKNQLTRDEVWSIWDNGTNPPHGPSWEWIENRVAKMSAQ
jgi:hypothetical protein